MVITYYDIVIIGGGIIGENILYALKNHTQRIAILDDSKGYKATHAAGGMLGAQNEFTEDSPLYQLSMKGQAMMPAHITALEQLSGQSIDLQQHGLLKIASSDGLIPLRQQYHFLHANHPQFKWIEDKQMDTFANGAMNKDYQYAMWIPTDGQVNAKKYLKALQTVNDDLPHLSEKVIDIRSKDGKYHIVTNDNIIITQKIIIAAGCKSGNLLNMLGYNFDMHGVKGEVLTLHHPNFHLNETLFQTNGHYIVPKSENQFLIGATTSLDTHKHPSAEGVNWLLDETFKLIPTLRNSTIVNIDCGFRPDSAFHRPIIDCVDQHLYVATGHYRNGILLSCITGELIRQMIYEPDNALYQQFKNSFQLGDTYEAIH